MILMILKWVLIVLVVLASVGVLFLRFAPTFGALPTGASKQRIDSSPNYTGKRFINLASAKISVNAGMALQPETTNNSPAQTDNNQGFLKNFIFPPKSKNPTKPIVTQPLNFDANQLQNGDLVWLGHSTVLFKTDGQTLITDPVFHRASPLPVGVKHFPMTNAPKTSDLPFVDAVLISHDHYDHLDHKAIKQMKEKVGHFYVPLGVKAHLMHWGVDANKISEYDWYEETHIADTDVKLVFTPTKHFSGRGLTNRNSTLWGSWVVKSPDLSVYFSGDGGYSPEFANIGQKYGGFDIAFIEDGAYNLAWADVHMLPEQSAQAGIDVNARVVLPIHWGKFDLSTHQWTDPVKRIKLAMAKHNASVEQDKQITIATPQIGQVFNLDTIPVQTWWE